MSAWNPTQVALARWTPTFLPTRSSGLVMFVSLSDMNATPVLRPASVIDLIGTPFSRAKITSAASGLPNSAAPAPTCWREARLPRW